MGRPRCARSRGRRGSNARFSKSGCPLVSRISEHIPDRGTIPDPSLLARVFFGRIQAATDLTNGAAILSDPQLIDLTHRRGLPPARCQNELADPPLLAHIPIAIGGSDSRHSLPNLSGKSFPTSAPFEDFGSLVLGDHALNLQKQLIFRGLPNFSVEKMHFDSSTEKLFEQKNLMSVMACKPIRAVNIHLINASCCDDIT